MKTLPSLKYIFVLLLLSLTGCTLLGSDNDDEIERTLPAAFNLKNTTIDQLRNEVVPPDSLNIDAFVVNIIACPEDAACFLLDGILVSESLNATSDEEQLFFTIANPQQFEEEQQYVMSVLIRGNASGDRMSFDLLGYSRIFASPE